MCEKFKLIKKKVQLRITLSTLNFWHWNVIQSTRPYICMHLVNSRMALYINVEWHQGKIKTTQKEKGSRKEAKEGIGSYQR